MMLSERLIVKCQIPESALLPPIIGNPNCRIFRNQEYRVFGNKEYIGFGNKGAEKMKASLTL